MSAWGRRQADPAVLALSSGMVRAWTRYLADRRAGDPAAYERWEAYLRTVARPVPPPACDWCEDTGVVREECSLHYRCQSWVCARDDKRSDPDWTHSYVRPCRCQAGVTLWATSLARATAPRPARPAAPGPKRTSYGFQRVTER